MFSSGKGGLSFSRISHSKHVPYNTNSYSMGSIQPRCKSVIGLNLERASN